MFFYAMVWLGEAFDGYVFNQILRWRDRDWAKARHFVLMIYIGTLFSATVIASFSISLAAQQGHTMHFWALFMLFSAAVFAAINNHQILSVVVLRLSIYVVALLFIPIRDLVATNPPLWLQFFTVLFVLSFIIECSRSFLVGYVKNLRYINALVAEHEKTKAAYHAKQEFLATVSHELRTPLTAIKGSLQLINSGALGAVPPKMQHLFNMATGNSESLANLVDDLLDLQRAETGKLELHLEQIELGAVAAATVDRTRPYAARFDVTLHMEQPRREYWVKADRHRIEQVLVNMLSNAAKFSETGGRVEISIGAHDDQISLAVKDYGVGIPKDASDKVFEQFSQVNSSDIRRHGGTGLGMNISRHIMQAHGGEIDFESAEGVGTTFYVTLKEDKTVRPQPIPDMRKSA
ncbi:hypothetical protein A3731_05895 [Roseovarius sp. HI0049]|nr:hypothetical protein A3731_05895 [Roseovarius sp. HI0049]